MPEMNEIEILRLDKDLPLPTYAKTGDAGVDLMTTVDFKLLPGERALIPTGIALGLPEGLVGLIHPRSGLAHKLGLSIVNAPGTIDSGYRGEIKVNLINLDPKVAIELSRGDRIAQLVVQEFVTANFIEVPLLEESERGEGGHGSTGLAQS